MPNYIYLNYKNKYKSLIRLFHLQNAIQNKNLFAKIIVTTQPLKYLVQRINGINGWIANDFKRFYSHLLIENYIKV
jgi:hypothetical protein